MFEYGMNEQLNNLFIEVRKCAFSVLVDKGYTADKADKAVNGIKKLNIHETETGFRIEALVDDYKIIVFHHTDGIKVIFYGENKEEKEPQTQSKTDKKDKIFGETPCEPQKPFRGKTRVDRLEEELLNTIRHQKKTNIELAKTDSELVKRLIHLEKQLTDIQDIINAEVKDEIKKLENIVYGLANTIDETTQEQLNIKENINVINGKFKFIGESLSGDNRTL